MRTTVPCFVALALVTASAQAQSPWTRSDGGGYFQLAAYAVSYDKLYRSSGPDFRTSREITDITLEGYGEYGVADSWTLVGRVPFKLQDAGDPVANPSLGPTAAEGTLNAFGNIELGVRHRFHDDGFILSGQFDIEAPTGDLDLSTGLSTGYDAWTFTPTVSIGKGWDRWYLFGYGGFGFRTDGFSNIWNVGTEVGVRAIGELWLSGVLDVVQSFADGDAQLPQTNRETGLYLNDQEWIAYGFKARYGITEQFGVQASVSSAFDGNNVPKALLFGLGMYLQF